MIKKSAWSHILCVWSTKEEIVVMKQQTLVLEQMWKSRGIVWIEICIGPAWWIILLIGSNPFSKWSWVRGDGTFVDNQWSKQCQNNHWWREYSPIKQLIRWVLSEQITAMVSTVRTNHCYGEYCQNKSLLWWVLPEQITAMVSTVRGVCIYPKIFSRCVIPSVSTHARQLSVGITGTHQQMFGL